MNALDKIRAKRAGQSAAKTEAPKEQTVAKSRNRFGSRGGRGPIVLQPGGGRRRPRLPFGSYPAVQVTVAKYTNTKGAFVIECIPLLADDLDSPAVGKTHADVIVKSEYQDSYVGKFAAAAEGIDPDSPEITAFGVNGCAEAIDALLDRDFVAEPLILAATASPSRDGKYTNVYWSPADPEIEEAALEVIAEQTKTG